MLDHGAKWPPQPDWPATRLDRPGLRISTVAGLDQHLVGGDLAAWCADKGAPDPGVGAFGLAIGAPYRVRMARDRLLLVATSLPEPQTAWHERGYAVTDVGAGYHVFEITGPSALGLLARGTTLDPTGTSPSAGLHFAGVNALLYRHGDVDTYRLHVDRALAAYLWSWFETAAKAMPARG